MWVVTCHEDRQIDLKELAGHLGTNRLSFASPERMMRYLGVIPGAVTPLAAMNDHGSKVTMVLDEAVLQDDSINVHPLHNAAALCNGCTLMLSSCSTASSNTIVTLLPWSFMAASGVTAPGMTPRYRIIRSGLAKERRFVPRCPASSLRSICRSSWQVTTHMMPFLLRRNRFLM